MPKTTNLFLLTLSLATGALPTKTPAAKKFFSALQKEVAPLAKKVESKFLEKGVKIGTKFGRLGTAVEKPSLKILDTTGHYLESKINRGVLSKEVINTIKKPLVVLSQNNDRFLYLSEKAAVVVSKNGKLITTYSSKNFDKAVVNIIQQAKK